MKSTAKKIPSNTKLLCLVIGIWSFALMFSGVVMILSNRKEREDTFAGELVVQESIDVVEEVLGVEDATEYDIEVCYMDHCKRLESDVFLGMIENNQLSKNLVDRWVDGELKKFFAPLYEKKEVVKNSKGEYLSRISEYSPNYGMIYELLNELYLSGKYEISINLFPVMTASTDGKFAEKYIEVDNTQQKLYVWIDGVIVREIFLSGAREDSSVQGVFQIIDKGREPIAPGEKYMPYWMAFHYEYSKNTWYGLHGLIWKYRDDGSRWIEPVSNIGKRISGGCIRMEVADAKYLYGIFEKGDYVLVHN